MTEKMRTKKIKSINPKKEKRKKKKKKQKINKASQSLTHYSDFTAVFICSCRWTKTTKGNIGIHCCGS